MKLPGAVAAVVLVGLLPGVAAADNLLFAYFKEPADMGMFFAVSDDGYNWRTLNEGRPWLPLQHKGELMRDPFLTRGPDGEFHLVWTWAWRGTTFGYTHSPDLIHWSDQKDVALMTGVPGTLNTWAPEIYWDAAKKKWLMIWSSHIPSRHEGNRLYSAWTSDFDNFTRPEIFYDPGHMVIDATILPTSNRYYMIFKDERLNPLHKEIKIAEGPSLTGPWTNVSEALTPSWSEGPSITQIAGEYILYYDHYRDPRRFEAIASKDLKKWVNVTDRMHLPESAKHGSFLHVTAEERQALEKAHRWRLPDLYQSDAHGDPPYLTETGWRPLLNGRDLTGWHGDTGTNEWFTAPGVAWRRVFDPTQITAKPGPGDRIVNGKGKTANLVTDETFGSGELYLEFLVAKGSNSGVYLHGLYEVQIFDSYAFDGPLTIGDAGGIYDHVPPARNAARPPGEWQSLHIWFQAPQFDHAGKLMAKAKILRVLFNGVPVHENVTLSGPTTSALKIPQAARNPIMLQGDHGPIAFRNIYFKPLE